jgi:hypothetical protein
MKNTCMLLVCVAVICKVDAWYTVVDNGKFVAQACVLEKEKNKHICFDYFSPVILQLIVKLRAFLPLMFLGQHFSSYLNNNNL